MFQINNKEIFLQYESIVKAILLGCCSAFLFFLSNAYIQLCLFSGFVAIPLIFSALVYGDAGCFVSSFVAIILLLFIAPFSTALMFCVLMAFPVCVLAYFTMKSIVHKKKVWWYPESNLLNINALVMICSAVFLSLTVQTEDVILDFMKKIFSAAPAGSMFQDISNVYMNSLFKYVVGIEVLFYSIMNLIGFRIVLKHLRRLKIGIRNEFDFSNVSVSHVISIIPIVALSLSFLFPTFSYVFSTIFIASLLLPLINGVIVTETFFERTKRNNAMFMVYVLMLFFNLIVLFIIMIGIIDCFIDIKEKINKSRN